VEGGGENKKSVSKKHHGTWDFLNLKNKGEFTSGERETAGPANARAGGRSGRGDVEVGGGKATHT